MTVVVADTGPINYLLLIDEIALLERFFDRVLIPHEVHTELLSARAPTKVRAWLHICRNGVKYARRLPYIE